MSCNPSVVRHTVTPQEAIALLANLRGLGIHSFWPLDRSLVELPGDIAARIQGYRQITDAVLLASAMDRNGRLATFDAGLAQLATETMRPFISVIPV